MFFCNLKCKEVGIFCLSTKKQTPLCGTSALLGWIFGKFSRGILRRFGYRRCTSIRRLICRTDLRADIRCIRNRSLYPFSF